jgi:hypothetical protein
MQAIPSPPKTPPLSNRLKKLFKEQIIPIQAYLRDIVGSVPNHHTKANITIK